MYLCYKKLVSTIGLLLTLTACGGGGGSTTSAATTPIDIFDGPLSVVS